MIERRMMLASGECPWNCYFCGYGTKRHKKLSHEEMKEQIDNYFRGFKPGKIDKLKIYMHGSFLDTNQVPQETRKYLVEKCEEYGIEKLEVESRPEFVTRENLSDFKDIDLTIAIGLDVADDYYLRKLNKGFTISDYEDSTQIARSLGFDIKTYVLVNPPFVEDRKNILDKTVREALKFSDNVVLINCYLHKGTLLKQKIESEEEEEKIDWEPLSKEEFFDLTKNWLVKPNIDYDVRKKEAPPTWKAWIPRFSDESEIEGPSTEALKNPKFETWQKFLVNKYNPPENKPIALFLPDPGTKPFTESELFKKIQSEIKDLDLEERIHKMVISSPGVVPLEFEDYYPFKSYSWGPNDMDKDVERRYLEVTVKRLKNYLRSHITYYNKLVHFFEEGSVNQRVVEKVCEEMDVEIIGCMDSGMEEKSEESLQSLRSCLEGN